MPEYKDFATRDGRNLKLIHVYGDRGRGLLSRWYGECAPAVLDWRLYEGDDMPEK